MQPGTGDRLAQRRLAGIRLPDHEEAAEVRGREVGIARDDLVVERARALVVTAAERLVRLEVCRTRTEADRTGASRWNDAVQQLLADARHHVGERVHRALDVRLGYHVARACAVQTSREPTARAREHDARLNEELGTELLGEAVRLGITQRPRPVASDRFGVHPCARQHVELGGGREAAGERLHELSVRQGLPQLVERHHGHGFDCGRPAEQDVSATQGPTSPRERHRRGDGRAAPAPPGAPAGAVPGREPRRGGGGTIARAHGQGRHQCRGDRRRKLPAGPAQRARQGREVGSAPRLRPRQRFERHDGQRVEVRPTVHVLAARFLFGRHVAGRADRHARCGQRGRRYPHHVRHAEVRQEGTAAILVDQDVRWLDVAVHHAAPVCVIERRAHVLHDAQTGGERRAARREHAFERRAPHEGHDEEGDAFPRAEVIDWHDVGMGEGGCQRRLLLEPLQPHLARGYFGRQDLHRDDVAQGAVPSPVYEPHTAGADEAQDLVALPDGMLDLCGVRRLHARDESRGACRSPHSTR